MMRATMTSLGALLSGSYFSRFDVLPSFPPKIEIKDLKALVLLLSQSLPVSFDFDYKVCANVGRSTFHSFTILSAAVLYQFAVSPSVATL